MLNKRIFRLAFVFTLSIVLMIQSVKAAVDLLSFTVEVQGDSILVQWETATEIDNAGFYVTRSTNPGSSYVDISGFVPAEGSGVIGAEYQIVDSDVTSGITYYYILEAVDTSQNIEYHGPITVTLNGQETNTPTETSTASKTPSKTPKPSKTPTRTTVPTRTKTRTPVPSKTFTPKPPTLTATYFTETPTSTITPSITPSPTLLDAPELFVVLPSTNTAIPIVITATPLPTLLTPTPEGMISQLIETGSFMFICGICLLILIWTIIAVGIFVYIQKRNID